MSDGSQYSVSASDSDTSDLAPPSKSTKKRRNSPAFTVAKGTKQNSPASAGAKGAKQNSPASAGAKGAKQNSTLPVNCFS